MANAVYQFASIGDREAERQCATASVCVRRREAVKKVTKKLLLKKETLSLLLNPTELEAVVGGVTEGCSCPRGDLSECPGPA
jgi:hypothetical protein